MPKIGKDLLPDTSVKSAKPRDNTYMLRDGAGLWLVVEPTGKKWWKLRVVFVKKENSFSLGDYPAVSLAQARGKRDEIRKQIAAGIDPAVSRKAEKAKASGENSFEFVAKEWHDRFKSKWTEGHAEGILTRLKRDVFPYVGSRPIEEITPPEMLAVLRRVESRTLETAHRVKIACGQIYRYAIATGKATHNPVDALRGALPPVKSKHRAACQSALKNDPVSASKNDPLKIKKDGRSLRLCASGQRSKLKGLSGARMGQSVARRSGSKSLERIGTAMVIPGF